MPHHGHEAVYTEYFCYKGNNFVLFTYLLYKVYRVYVKRTQLLPLLRKYNFITSHDNPEQRYIL